LARGKLLLQNPSQKPEREWKAHSAETDLTEEPGPEAALLRWPRGRGARRRKPVEVEIIQERGGGGDDGEESGK
jgi:hypothetical protein